MWIIKPGRRLRRILTSRERKKNPNHSLRLSFFLFTLFNVNRGLTLCRLRFHFLLYSSTFSPGPPPKCEHLSLFVFSLVWPWRRAWIPQPPTSPPSTGNRCCGQGTTDPNNFCKRSYLDAFCVSQYICSFFSFPSSTRQAQVHLLDTANISFSAALLLRTGQKPERALRVNVMTTRDSLSDA